MPAPILLTKWQTGPFQTRCHRTPGAHRGVPNVCLLEVARVMCRERGEQAAADSIAVMTLGTVVPLDVTLAASAAFLGERSALPCADSVIYATAQAHGAEVWTHDEHFRGLPGVRFIEAAAD